MKWFEIGVEKLVLKLGQMQVEEVRLEVAVKLRQCIEQLGGKAVDLFQIIAKGEDVASVEEDRMDTGKTEWTGQK